jgi:hypothetical protein
MIVNDAHDGARALMVVWRRIARSVSVQHLKGGAHAEVEGCIARL